MESIIGGFDDRERIVEIETSYGVNREWFGGFSAVFNMKIGVFENLFDIFFVCLFL
jgi:hypothetical protein